MTTGPERPLLGLLDTSVVVAMANEAEGLNIDLLPDVVLITALTIAELEHGHVALTPGDEERARRGEHLFEVRQTFPNPLPFDADAAAAFGFVAERTLKAGRKVKGARMIDLLIASIALAHEVPLYTRNPADVMHLTPHPLIVGV